MTTNHPWKALATANNLNFEPGTIFNSKRRVFGEYKGHRLELNLYKENSGNSQTVFTHLSIYPNLTINNQTEKKRLSPQDTLSQFNAISATRGLKGLIKTDKQERIIYYQQEKVETDIKYLQYLFDLLSDIATIYPAMVALGGEAVPTLQPIAATKNSLLRFFTASPPYHFLHFVAIKLLQEIELETTKRLGYEADDLFCPNCLTFVNEHKANRISYYGCRNCGQSREFIKVWLIAVLDQAMTVEQTQKADELRVNWLIRRNLFDFDVVEIIQATDEDVERFAVQVGNDTDHYRQTHYKKIDCLISATCHLNQNTKRILERTFRKIIEIQ